MREIILQFEGHEDSEKKAADTIQAAIFEALQQERMNIRCFTNQPVKGNPRAFIGTANQMQKEFEIPSFLQPQSGTAEQTQ